MNESEVKVVVTEKETFSVMEAKRLIAHGDLLESSLIRQFKKAFSGEEQRDLCQHFAQVICDNRDDVMGLEIAAENFLLWLDYEYSQQSVDAFVQGFMQHPDAVLALRAFTELVLGAEVPEEAREGELFPLALALICELGIGLVAQDRKGLKLVGSQNPLLKQINTYLLSVSNSTNTEIRLSLIHYFGYLSKRSADEMSAFNRVMGRFGQTMLDQLFHLLFIKKSEAIALMFLVENLPYILEANSSCQKMLHEALKNCMLKHPERFNLFLEAMAEQLLKKEIAANFAEAATIFIQHLGALCKVTSELNHKALAKDLLNCLIRFKGNKAVKDVMEALLSDPSIRLSFRPILTSYADPNVSASMRQSIGSPVRPAKRGRKPSFSKAPEISTLGQVSFLGAQDLSSAS